MSIDPAAAASLFSFRGRLGPAGFALRYLCLTPFAWLLFLAGAHPLAAASMVFAAALAVLSLPFAWAGTAAAWRRLHDMGVGGWWIVLLLPACKMAFHSAAPLLVLLALIPGQAGENRFGRPPPGLRLMHALWRIRAAGRAYRAGKISAETFNAARRARLAALDGSFWKFF